MTIANYRICTEIEHKSRAPELILHLPIILSLLPVRLITLLWLQRLINITSHLGMLPQKLKKHHKATNPDAMHLHTAHSRKHSLFLVENCGKHQVGKDCAALLHGTLNHSLLWETRGLVGDMFVGHFSVTRTNFQDALERRWRGTLSFEAEQFCLVNTLVRQTSRIL